VLEATGAKAVDLRAELSPGIANPNFGRSVSVEVAEDGGYYGKTASTHLPNGFAIKLAVSQHRELTLDVSALVDDNRVAVTYYRNGGVGVAPANKLAFVGDRVAVDDQGTLARDGYSFGGWGFTGTGQAAYQAGETFNIYEDVRLYAIWVAIPAPPAAPLPPQVIVQQTPPQIIVQSPVVVSEPGESGEADVIEVQVPYEVPTEVPGAIQTVIEQNATPTTTISGNWSLVSVLLALITFAAALILALLSLRRREDSYDDFNRDEDYSTISDQAQAEQKRLARLRMLSGVIAILGLVPAVLFVLLDDLAASMVLVNSNTIIVAIAVVVEFALIAIRLILGRRNKDNDDDGQAISAEAEVGALS
jgi:hypothetical protein